MHTQLDDYIEESVLPVKPTLFAFWIILGLVFLRPTILGQSMSAVGLVILTIAAAFSFLRARAPSDDQTLHQGLFLLCLLSLGFWLYGFTVSVINAESNLDFLYKSVTAGIVTTLAFYFLLFDRALNEEVFKWLARMNSLLGWSIAITSLLLIVLPYGSLMIGHMDIKGYDFSESGNGDILFPFSIMYGELSEYHIYRFLGIYRETGIAQMVFCWSFIFLALRRASWFWWLGALLGALMCGSSAVVVSLAASSIVYFGFSNRKGGGNFMVLALIMVTLVIAAIYTPGLGLSDKQETHGSSIEDRSHAIGMAFDDFPANIFGRGLYRLGEGTDPLGINALSSIYYYGMVGLSIFVSCFFIVPVVAPGQRIEYMTATIPILMTALLFQPLVDAPFAFVLLFCTSYVTNKDTELRHHDLQGIP